MKYKILNLKFSFVALLMNTVLLESTYASEIQEDHHESPSSVKQGSKSLSDDIDAVVFNTILAENKNTKIADQKKISPSPNVEDLTARTNASARNLKYDINIQETKRALYETMIKWHEAKNQPAGWLSGWRSSDKSLDIFDPDSIQYAPKDNKTRFSDNEYFTALVEKNTILEEQIFNLGLNMAARDVLDQLLEYTLSSISIDTDENPEEATSIEPNQFFEDDFIVIEPASKKAEPSQKKTDILSQANPFFVDSLTLKGQKLTSLSAKDIQPLIQRLVNLRGLSLEFKHFERRILTSILSLVPHITSLTLSGNLIPSQLTELLRIPKFFKGLEEFRLYDTSQIPDPMYATELNKLFDLRPNMKVLGLSASANNRLDTLGFFIQLSNRLRSLNNLELIGLTPAHPIFNPSNQILYYLVNKAFDTFEVTYPDNPTLLERVQAEKAQASSNALPIVSG